MLVPEAYALLLVAALLPLERCEALLLQCRARRGSIPCVSPTAYTFAPHSSGGGYRYCCRSERGGSRSLRCAAVALAVSTRSLCEGEDSDSIPQNHLDGVSREGAESTVVGEIVLSDWLDELPLAALGLPSVGRLGANMEQDGQGSVQLLASASGSLDEGGDGSARGDSSNSEQGDDDTPFRFQQLIQVSCNNSSNEMRCFVVELKASLQSPGVYI